MNLGTASVIRANARDLPLPDNSVDLVVTSPPYFALRSYQDGGEHYAGQIGSEPTPAEFVASLLEVTRECVRVLKPSGSLWVNLGDKYSSTLYTRTGKVRTVPQPDGQWNSRVRGGGEPNLQPVAHQPGVPNKSLMGIPWRYALACIDDLGLILRAEVIWSKPNGLPESVTDRVRRSHEQWFYFEQSRGDVVESGAQALPLCSLCGRPADSRSSLVARLHELDPSIEDGNLSDEVRTNERVEREGGLRAEEPGVVGLHGSAVPLAVPGDPNLVEDSTHFLDDGQVSVVDQDAEVRATGAAVTEGNAALPVDDSSEPGEVCRCSHPLIVNDEPWIPQQLAADLMQMVADGEADAQAVSDFLSGDYARSHSTWFHFTLEPRYFSAVDEIRELATNDRSVTNQRYVGKSATGNTDRNDGGAGNFILNPLGKLPGSVWTVPTEPLRVPDHLGIDHFAAFPTEWPKRIIQGWSPRAVCGDCGFLLGSSYDNGMLGVRRELRAPSAQRRAGGEVLLEGVREPSHIAESEVDEVPPTHDARLCGGLEAGASDGTEVGLHDGAPAGNGRAPGPDARASRGRASQKRSQDGQPDRESGTPREDRARPATEAGAEALRLPSLRRHDPDLRDALACPHCGSSRLARPVVADIFGGTGTTAMVAKALGRHGITVDMSADYCRLAEWRTNDRNQLAKVLGVEKAPEADAQQLDLFGEATA